MTAAAGKCVMTTTMVTTTLLHSRHIVDDLESMQRIKPSMQLAKVSITVHSSRRPQFGRRLSSVQQFRGDKEVRADSTSIAGRCLPSTNISKELVFPHQFVLRTPQSRVFPDKEMLCNQHTITCQLRHEISRLFSPPSNMLSLVRFT